MALPSRILAVIAASPSGVSLAELRASVPEASSKQLHNALHALRQAKAIEPAGYAAYRVRPRRATATRAVEQAGAFLLPLSRLMAGR